MALNRMPEPTLRIDTITIRTSDSKSLNHTGFLKIGHDSLRGSLRYTDLQCDFPQRLVRIMGKAKKHMTMVC